MIPVLIQNHSALGSVRQDEVNSKLGSVAWSTGLGICGVLVPGVTPPASFP